MDEEAIAAIVAVGSAPLEVVLPEKEVMVVQGLIEGVVDGS